MKEKQLEPVQEFAGPILAQQCAGPVLRDDWPNGPAVEFSSMRRASEAEL
jgi:hypothetical protein